MGQGVCIRRDFRGGPTCRSGLGGGSLIRRPGDRFGDNKKDTQVVACATLSSLVRGVSLRHARCERPSSLGDLLGSGGCAVICLRGGLRHSRCMLCLAPLAGSGRCLAMQMIAGGDKWRKFSPFPRSSLYNSIWLELVVSFRGGLRLDHHHSAVTTQSPSHASP